MYTPNSHGKKLLYPGRGIRMPRPKRLPKSAKLHAELCAVWGTTALELTGAAADVALASTVQQRLREDTPPTDANPEAEAWFWWLLHHTWRSIYCCDKKMLNASRRHATRIVDLWAGLGGCAFATRAVVRTWDLELREGVLHRRRSAFATDLQETALFFYSARPRPGFSLLQALRLRLAMTDEEDYAATVAFVRASLSDLPAHLRAALVFLVPTEQDLAHALLEEMEASEGGWPNWGALVAWSLTGREAFERLAARTPKSIFAGNAAFGFAFLEQAPELLPRAIRQHMRTYLKAG